MHKSVMAYVREMVEILRLAGCDTLEVGSYNVNGTVRPLFHGAYIGVDMRPGPGVDQVATAGNLPFESNSFDVVISTEMLEHDPRPWASIPEMARVLRPAGVLILTARGYDHRGCYPVHDFPADYWRFSCGGMTLLVEDAGLKVYNCLADFDKPGVFVTAVKP